MSAWHQELETVYRVAAQSPDPSTQNGAMLIHPLAGQLFISLACNTFPQGVVPSADRLKRPAKYGYVEHAERRAIYTSARYGFHTSGLTMVAAWAACADCARAIAQAGIVQLVRHSPPADDKVSARWADSIEIGDTILRECGVEIIDVTDPIPEAPPILRDGRLWQP